MTIASRQRQQQKTQTKQFSYCHVLIAGNCCLLIIIEFQVIDIALNSIRFAKDGIDRKILLETKCIKSKKRGRIVPV